MKRIPKRARLVLVRIEGLSSGPHDFLLCEVGDLKKIRVALMFQHNGHDRTLYLSNLWGFKP